MLESENGVFGPSGRLTTDHVDVAGFAVFWVEVSYRSSDIEAPVPSLGHILIVTELKHELVARLSILSSCKTTCLDAFAEPIVR